jgi:hypothetical protein
MVSVNDAKQESVQRTEILDFKVYKDEGKLRPEKKTFEELIKEKKI